MGGGGAAADQGVRWSLLKRDGGRGGLVASRRRPVSEPRDVGVMGSCITSSCCPLNIPLSSSALLDLGVAGGAQGLNLA